MKSDVRSLREKILSAGSWVLLGHFLSQVIRLGGNLILTRLLVPEMFGLMAVVTVFLAGIAMFSDLGIKQNIIQSERGEEKAYIDTAWTIQIIRGFVITILILAASWLVGYSAAIGISPIGSVYADPQLPMLLAVMSVTGLIAGFNSLNIAIQNRGLKLKNIIILEVVSQALGLIVMVALAWYFRNIWSLVAGTLLSTFLKMLLSHHAVFGPKASLAWDKEAALEIFHFGKWIFGASIFTFLAGQGDRLLLGALISPAELGIYTIAFFLAMALKEIVKKVMSSVFYPALSEVVRTRPHELKQVYYRIRSRLDVAVMVIVGVMASSGSLVIDLLYDDRYADAGWMLEILSLSIIFLGTTMAGVCLMALGNSKSIMVLTAVSSLFLFVSVPIAYSYFGLYGAVVAIALNAVVEIPIIIYLMKRYEIWSWFHELKMWPVFFVTFAFCQYVGEAMLIN